MSSVPPIWKALINRDVITMETILIKDPTQANTPHPRSNELLLDTALYWGYLPESKMLLKYNAIHKNSPIGSSLNMGNIDMLNWVYDNISSDVNEPSIPEAVFASTITNDETKYNAFLWLMNKGSNYMPYMFNAVILSPLATKYLVENGKMDLTYILPDGKTILDMIELRNITHPYTQYLLPDKSNELFYYITVKDYDNLKKSTGYINKALSNMVGSPYLWALTVGDQIACKILIDKGCYLAFKTPYGKNAIASSISSKSIPAIGIARNNSNENDIDIIYKDRRNAEVCILKNAIYSNCTADIISFILTPYNGKRGANPNILCQGIPPVAWLGYNLQSRQDYNKDHINIFKTLVDNKSNVDSYNNVIRSTPREFYIKELINIGMFDYTINEITNYGK